METLKLIFLGAFQGVAEFLPISSSGHLALLQKVFHLEDPDQNVSLDILLHLGTLISIIMVYYKDIWKLILEAFKLIGDLFKLKPNFFKNDDRKLITMIIIATIPTGVLGLIVEHYSEVFKTNTKIVGSLLLVTALILFLSQKFENGTKDIKKTTWFDSLLIGIAQGFAVLPGISRSGTTITASMSRGLNKELAVKFSFFMSMPVILLAALKNLILDEGLTGFKINYIYAMIAAIIVGYFSIKLLIKMIANKKFSFFAWYCIVIGLITIIFI